MKQSRQTRVALLASMLSVFLCMAVLAGTTLAWFTDGVANSGNAIQAGTVKAGLYYRKEPTTDYQPVTDQETPVLAVTALTPSAPQNVWFQIKNEGAENALPFTYSIYLRGTGKNTALARAVTVYSVDANGEKNRLGTLADLMVTEDGQEEGVTPLFRAEEGQTLEAEKTVECQLSLEMDTPPTDPAGDCSIYFELVAEQPDKDAD